ncbi:2'-5' RNA ligase family protein [Streptomyces sp. NPDC127098]|uniref:2'-5' RNA ligase family protein n=1 Tax=Streptomyces sp. NPDC127098 TaxID=3347137 RepID=UPI0036641014
MEWTHVTVLHSAPLGEVTADQVEEVTTRVRKACATVAPFELTVGRPSVGTVAIECPAWPGPLARPLWQITAQASRDVWQDAYPTLPAKYYPHLSVAYAGENASEADRTDLKVALSDCGDVGTVTFTVDKLWLVAQRHDGRHITWRVLDQVLLGR